MQRKTKILLTSVTVAIAAFLTLIVGPFTFYASVVPFLGPVLPRPDGVPRTAEASYSWKGFGLFWRWEREFRNGCARWGAAESYGYSSVEFIAGNAGCDSVGLSLEYRSHSDHVVFGRGGERMGGKPCPFKVSTEQIGAFRQLISEATKVAYKNIEQSAVSQIKSRLATVDGQTLTTDATGGCNDLKPSDYGNPDPVAWTPNPPSQ